jgi:hypothetical protein
MTLPVVRLCTIRRPTWIAPVTFVVIQIVGALHALNADRAAIRPATSNTAL